MSSRKPRKQQTIKAQEPVAKKQKKPSKSMSMPTAKPKRQEKKRISVSVKQNQKAETPVKPKSTPASISKTKQEKAKKPQVKKVVSFISDSEKEFRSAKRQKSTADGSKYYVTNKLLLEEMVKWRDSNKEEEDKLRAQGREDEIDYTKRVISEKLGEMIRQIAIRLTNHSYFRNYTKEMKEDMIGHACLKIIKGLKGYKFKYTNVFAYFTTACFNSFKAECLRHYKQINIRNAVIEDYIGRLDYELPNSSTSKALKKNLSIFDSSAEGYNNSIDDND